MDWLAPNYAAAAELIFDLGRPHLMTLGCRCVRAPEYKLASDVLALAATSSRAFHGYRGNDSYVAFSRLIDISPRTLYAGISVSISILCVSNVALSAETYSFINRIPL